jgi:ubiquinone/menaquinone biosynthesis C-methylase UbiE
MLRTVIPELLDSDAGSRREVEDSLADLRMINRYFGGLRSMTLLLLRVAAQCGLKTISWLDVAGGRGDLAALVGRSLQKRGIDVQPTLLDRAPSHMLTQAGAGTNGSVDKAGYPAIAGDALALPFKAGSFDIVGCCLFLHHLEPEQVVRFVAEALRVARHGVVINDLIRHPLHVGLAYAGYALYRSRLTRHDSVASVRRAYTLEEIKGMLPQTQAHRIEVQQFFPFRMGVIAWKNPLMTSS